MGDESGSFLEFLKGQEICQIAFGMYDLSAPPAVSGGGAFAVVIATGATFDIHRRL